jgi:hypothetical protein
MFCHLLRQVVGEKWSAQDVVAWAREIMGFSEVDASALARWRGLFLATAVEEQVPSVLSAAAAAMLVDVLRTKNWSRLYRRPVAHAV